MKRIKTQSGAEYLVSREGAVFRKAGDTPIAWTVDDHQYAEGELNPFMTWQTYDNLEIGNRLYWLGVVNDFAEPIASSLIASIKEE